MLIRILGLHAALRASSVKGFYVNLYVILWLVFHFLFRKFKSKLQKRKKKKFRNDLLRAECVLSKCQNVYLSRCIGSTSDIKVWLAKSETNINKKDKKITYYGHENRLGVDKVKKVVLFPEIGRVKNDLSFNHPNASNAYTVVSEYTIQFQANTHRATNKKQRELNKRKTKETVCEFAFANLLYTFNLRDQVGICVYHFLFYVCFIVDANLLYQKQVLTLKHMMRMDHTKLSSRY